MADTPTGETVTQGDSQTTVQTPAPTQGNAVDPAEVERLRKEAEQKELRIRQLENEKAAREKVEEEARQKQLADNEQWKELAETEKARREALEKEREEAELKQTLQLAQDTIFAEFSQEAIDVAKEAGLSLADDSDEAKETFKTKLSNIQSKVMKDRVTPNNPTPPQETSNREELVGRMRMGDKSARDEAIGGLEVLDVMRAQAGYTKQP